MATPYKMKNSALHKSAKHGSPMQQNYDNTLPEVNVSPKTTPNKKDFVSTHVKKGITVPKKTTLENLTKKQTGPLEGRESIPTWNNIYRSNISKDNKKGKTRQKIERSISRKDRQMFDGIIRGVKSGLMFETLNKGKGKTKKTVEKKGKTDKGRGKTESTKTNNRVVNTLNTLSPKNIYNTVVPKPLRDLNKGIVNLITKK